MPEDKSLPEKPSITEYTNPSKLDEFGVDLTSKFGEIKPIVNLGGVAQGLPTLPWVVGDVGTKPTEEPSANDLWKNIVAKTGPSNRLENIPLKDIYIGDRYGKETMPYTDVEEAAYQKQSGWDRIGNAAINLGVKTVGFLTQTAGFILGAPFAAGGGSLNLLDKFIGGQGDIINKGRAVSFMTDNILTNLGQSWHDDIQDAFPIYKQSKYSKGDILSKLGTSDWWLDDAIDRAALGISMLAPGFAEAKGLGLFGVAEEAGGVTKATGVFSKALQALNDNPETYSQLGQWMGRNIAKFAATGTAEVEASNILKFKDIMKGAQNLELYAWNVIGQSALNGREAQVGIRKALQEQKEQGLINLTDEEIEDKAALGAAIGFWATTPLSLGAALFELPQVFSTAKMGENLFKKFFTKNAEYIEGSLEKMARPSIPNLLKKAAITGFEHGQNESAQVAIGRYLEEAIAGKIDHGKVVKDDRNPFEAIYRDYIDNINDPNGQNNIALGTIQGIFTTLLGHGVKSYRGEYKAMEERNKNFVASINQAMANRRYWSMSPSEFFEKDGNGKIVLDDQFRPKLNQQKLADMTISLGSQAKDFEDRMIALQRGDQARLDELNFKSLAAISNNFFNIPKGMEYLRNVLKNEADRQAADPTRVNDVVNGIEITPHMQLERNMALAEKLKVAHDAIENKHAGFTYFGIDVKDETQVQKRSEYIERLKYAQYDNAANQIYVADRLDRNTLELSSLGAVDTNELIADPSSPTEERINNIINENRQLIDEQQDLRNQYKLLTDKNLIKKEFENYLKSDDDAKDVIEDIKSAKPRDLKTAVIKQLDADGKPVDTTVNIGERLFLDTPILKDENKLILTPSIGILSPEFGGSFKVLLPNDKVAYLSADEFKKYKITDGTQLDPLIPAMMSKAIDNVLSRDEYKNIEKPTEAKLDYINDLDNPKLINDVENEFNSIAKDILERRKELDRQNQIILKSKEDIDNEQTLIDGKSGNVGTDSNEADIKAYAKIIAELPWEDKKKSYEELFSSTKTESEDWADQTLSKEHVKRSREFLHNAPFFPNRNKMRAVLVTPNSEAFFGLEGLAKLSYGDNDMSKATDVNDGFVAAVFVVQEGGKNYFVNKNGNKLSEVGEKADLSQIIFQTMPTTKLEGENDKGEKYNLYRNTQKVEAEAQQKWWIEKRTKLFEAKQDTPIQYYSFDVSQGIPNEITTEEVDPVTNEKKVVRERNSVSDVFFKSLAEDDIERLLREDGGLIQISDDGNISFKGKNYKYPKGRPVLKYGDNISFLQNAKLTTAKANAVYEVLNQMAQRLLADAEAGKKIKLDPIYTEFLQNTLYWKKGEITAKNQMKLDPGTGTLYLGNTTYPIGMIAEAKDEIVEQLKTIYHNVNRNTLKDASAKFTEFYIDDKGQLAEREWQNYQTYLLSSALPDGSKRSIDETPLSTSLAAPSTSVPFTFKQKYAILSGLEAPAETIEQAKKAAAPPPAPPAPVAEDMIGKHKIDGKTTNKYELDGNRSIDFTATFDANGLVIASVKDGIVVDDIAADKNKVQSLVNVLEPTGKFPAELFKKSGVEGVYANPTEIVRSYLELKIQAELDKQKAEQAKAAPKAEEKKEEVAPPSDIEAKKAYIKKERQEAIDRIADIQNNLLPRINNRLDNNLQPELSKLYEKLRNTKDKTLQKEINDEIDKLNKKVLTKNDIIDLTRQKESLEGQLESAKKFIEKKDAELAALEGAKPEAPVSIEAERERINKEWKEELEREKEKWRGNVDEKGFPKESWQPIEKRINDKYTARLESLTGEEAKPAAPAKFDPSKTSNKSGKKYRLSRAGEKGAITDAEIQIFKQWHGENVPFLPYEMLNHMIETFDGREAFGVFENGVAKFFKKGLRGTEYHEIFHGIWKGFLSREQQKGLIDEFRTREGSFKDRLTGKTISYSQATEDQIEDRIADDFSEYRKGKLPARNLGEKIKRFFKAIIDFFKSFVTNPSLKEQLFDAIDSGKFKTAKPSAESISEIPAYRLKEGLTEQQINGFVKDMVVRASSMVLGNQETKKLLFQPNKITGEEIFERIKQDYIEDDKFGPNPDQLSEKAFEMLKKRTKEFLRTAPFNINMNDEDRDSYNAENSNKADYAPQALTIDVKKSAPQAIRLAVGTLPETDPTNQENSSKIEMPEVKENGNIKGLSLINYARGMATLLDKLSNTNKVGGVVDKLISLAKSNANYVRFFKRIGGDISKENPTIRFENFDPEDWRLFVQMMQTFTVQKPDVKIEYTSGSEVYTGSANLNTVVNQTKDSWIESMKAKARAGESVLTYVKEKKEYKLSSKKELEAMPITTPQDQIKFLGNLGINFSFEDYSNLKTKKQPGETKSEVEQFADATSSIRAYIGKGNSIVGVTAEVLGINGPMTTLAELYKKATDPNQDTSYSGVDGKLRQAYTLNNAASYLENDFNECKTLNELLELRPALRDLFATNSQILKKGGIFFTAKGERTDVQLKVGVIAGKKNTDTDKGTATTSLNKGERIVTELNRNLNGEYYILIAGDSATEWTMMLGNQISYAEFEGGRAWTKINKIFRGYLSDDIALALDYENRQQLLNIYDPRRISEIESRLDELKATSDKTKEEKEENENLKKELTNLKNKPKELRFFKDILPEEMNAKITEMIDGGMTKEQIEEYVDKNIEKVNEAIKSYLTAQAVETRRILTQRGQIEEMAIKKVEGLTAEQIDNLRRFKFLGLEDKFTDRTDVSINKRKMTLNELNNLLLFARTNYNISNIEFHKILFGDPYEFAIKEKNGKIILDETKRIKSFESGRQSTFDSPEFNAKHNDAYNQTGIPGEEGRIRLSPRDPGYHTFKSYANTVTARDINIMGTVLGKTNEADAFSWLMDGAYREIKLKNGKWDDATDEVWHQWQMAYTRQRLAAKKVYKYTNEALRKHDAELIQKPEPKNFIEVLKPIVTGSKYDRSYIDNILDKTSQMPLYYKAVEGTNLEQLYIKMFKEGKDYLIVESGRKVGAETLHDLYKDGKFNEEPFNNNIQVPWSAYGIQVENTYDDMGGLVRMGSQGTKMVTMNLYNNGVPTSKRADIATKNNFDLLKELYKIGYNDVLKKMGLVDLGNQTYDIVDKKKLSKSLEYEMLRREMSQNAKDVIQTDENGEFRVPFEATGSYIQIRSIIFSMIDKAITSRKTNGGSYVQTPVTLWESAKEGRRLAIKEKTGYRQISREEYDSLDEASKKKVVLTDDTLKFYTKESPYCEIMLPHWFKEKLDKKKYPNDEAILNYLNKTEEGRKILEGIAFRIPTQALSSMERIVVKGFLPAFMGKTVVVPSEITTKAGSDFDIDKLNIYLKSIYLDKDGNIRLVQSKGSLANRESATKEFYGTVYDEILQSKINRIERFDEFRDKLFDLFKKIESFGDITPEQIEERLSEEDRNFYNFHYDVISEIDNQAFEKDMETSDYIDSQIEQMGIAKEELTSKLFNEQLRSEYIDKMYRKAIENDYYDSMSKLLGLPENYKHLISPVDDAGLSKLADKVDALRGVDESKIKNRILDANYMSELRHNFITAKDWIGIVAVNIIGHSITQKSRIYIDPSRFGKLGYVDKKFLDNGSIILPHNTVMIEGKPYTSMSGIMTADGTSYISDRLSGYGTAVVDVVKDPFILKLIQSNLSIGTTMFLERIGAGETGLMFMQQPIIVEYLTMLDNKNANTLFKSENIKAIKNKFPATTRQIADAKIDVNGFENNIEQYRKGFKAEQNAEQQKILDEFLKYAKMAQYSFKLTQATNYDTTKFGSGDTLFLKNTREDLARETNIFSSVDDMLDNTHLGTQASYLDALTRASAKYLILERPEIRNITNNVLRRYAEQEYLSKDKFEKIANKVKASFLDYVLQVKTNLGDRIYELLIDPKTSVASRIAEAKEKYPYLQILKELDVTSTQRVDGAKSLKLRANSKDGYTEDMYADMMRELRDENEETKALYNDIVNVALLQGTYRSAISIRNIIPNEDLSEKLKDVMTTLVTDADMEAFANGAFEKNNFRDDDIWKEIVPNFVPAVQLPPLTGDKAVDEAEREAAYETKEPIGVDEYDEDVYQYIALEYFPTIEELNISTVDRKVLLLDKKQNFIESQAEFVKFPKVIKKDGMNINVVSGTTISDALMRKTYATGDKSLNDVFGYQKVRYPDGTEFEYADGDNNRFSVYRMINLLGDGQYATEHYVDGRKSVIENGTVKVENEVSSSDLISYFRSKMGIDTDVSKETIDETKRMLEAKAISEEAPTTTASIQMQPFNIEKIKAGTKTTTTRSQREFEKIGISIGQSAIVNFGGKDFKVTNRGLLSIEEAGGKEAMLKSEGYKSVEDLLYQQTKDWMNGKGKLYIYDIAPITPKAETTDVTKIPAYTVDSTLKNADGSIRYASTDGNVIRLNPVTDANKFFDYFEGKEKGPTSAQKGKVVEELAKQGYTIDVIKSMLNTNKLINTFLVLHEQSHIDNNDKDVYWQNSKDLLTPDKIAIEVRATIDALEKMKGDYIKATEYTPAENTIIDKVKSSETKPTSPTQLSLFDEGGKDLFTC